MTIEERLSRHLGQTPRVENALWVAPNATIIGDVILSSLSSIFYGAVLRGDIAQIRIGEGSNVQDNVVIHLADDLDVEVGRHCTIGHSAILHACTIGDECLIGMGATILDGAVIGARSFVAAGSLVPPGMTIPPGSRVMGHPAKITRALSAEEQDGLKNWAEKYVHVARAHAALNAKNLRRQPSG